MADVTSGGRAALPGRPRIRQASTETIQPLHEGWLFCATAPAIIDGPAALEGADLAWKKAVVPGTVAAALRSEQGNAFNLERCPDFDAHDWWYRCRFRAVAPGDGEVVELCFDGLASIAQVWLNGTPIVTSHNMFVPARADVTSILRSENDLVIRFASLRTALEARRPRPRWRTKLVEHQQLRWHRVTLLGRMPGWSPPVRAVGPWRDVRIERHRIVQVVDGDVAATALATGGVVDASMRLRLIQAGAVRSASLKVGNRTIELDVADATHHAFTVRGRLEMPEAEHWWPHTHGQPRLYETSLIIRTDSGDAEIALGRIGFRRVEIDRSGDDFRVLVNGERVFCRGACWSTPDIVTLGATQESYRHLLVLARDAGMNMIRIGGTMVYEADAFFDVCDELGILVWQDFMFANMDYPATDASFVENVAAEAEAVLARLRRHPSLAVLCGNSEVEQQVAMLGLEAALRTNAIFQDVLPSRAASAAPGLPYVPSTPTGGALPFHVDTGVSHYYGVGAYLRPLEDARRSNVRFTSECLGFSNIPDQRAVDALLPGGESPFHHPKWKTRVPRDQGTGWDFEDIRDHYLKQLCGVDPLSLRYADMERYLTLSRVVTGEVMARTMGEWRRAGTTCNGALIWFFQDLWLGAGWGLISADGRPKAAYYILRRALQPVSLTLTDEGVNGVSAHVVNDTARALAADVHVSLLRGGATVTATASSKVVVPPRSATAIRLDSVLGRFYDVGYAHRFGPPGHDVVAATLTDETGRRVGDAWHFIGGLPVARTDEPLVTGTSTAIDDRTLEVTLRASRFAAFIALDCGEFLPEDNYFHMVAGEERRIYARAAAPVKGAECFAQPLNAFEAVRFAGA